MLASFLQRGACVPLPRQQGASRCSPLQQQHQLPGRISLRSSSTSEAEVSDEEAQRFEKIAAALIEKLKDLPDEEEEPLGKSFNAAQPAP